MQTTLSTPSRNGTPISTKKSKAPPATKKARKSKTVLSPRRKIAVGVGCVGVAVLALSVVHCTEAIQALTHSGIILSVLLALGIDAGLVMCELAAIISTH